MILFDLLQKSTICAPFKAISVDLKTYSPPSYMFIFEPSASPGFCRMKRPGLFLLPPGWDASPSQCYPPALNLLVPI